MTLQTALRKIDEWIFRRTLIAGARAELARAGERRARALAQAKLVAEVARRVSEPVEALPPGCGSDVALLLYREAVYWALVAARLTEGEPPGDLRNLWAERPPDRVLASAGGAVELERARAALLDGAASRALDRDEKEVQPARRLAEALVATLEAPRRRLARLIAQRCARTALAATAILVMVVGGWRLVVGPDLAAGKTYRASSYWSGCVGDARCAALLFHTDAETNPWAELDLGAPETFRRIEITNREDCCAERAVPLVVEASNDRSDWREIARHEEPFSIWKIKLPATTARYLRFKIPKPSVLHMHEIVVRR